MLVWIRVFVIGVLGAVVPHSGHSQDIIYDGNSAPNGSNISSQTQTQSIEQPRFPETQSPLTTDMPSFISETARQPELNLFDLTATIPEDVHTTFDVVEDNNFFAHHQHDVGRTHGIWWRRVLQTFFYIANGVITEVADQAAVESWQRVIVSNVKACLELLDKKQRVVCLH